MENTIHIGEIICRRLRAEGRTKKWLAEQVNCDASSFCKTLKKTNINTEILLKINFALSHDFFQYFTSYYNENQQYKQQNGK